MTAKPRLLDLFCGAGGATKGYQQAGFHVTGVDIKYQPHYVGNAFIKADALKYGATYGREFDVIHASPPCQYYSRLRYLPWLRNRIYWRSIPPTRLVLQNTGKPYVIENIEDAGWDMRTTVTLCGQMFNLPIFRHRRFEVWPNLLLGPPHEKHYFVIEHGRAVLGKRHHGFGYGVNGWGGAAGHQGNVDLHRRNLGIPWMTGAELGQAVPPCYTQYIGQALLNNQGFRP